MGLQSAFSGAKRWEEKQPLVALSLLQLAESYAQQDPTLDSSANHESIPGESYKDLHKRGDRRHCSSLRCFTTGLTAILLALCIFNSALGLG